MQDKIKFIIIGVAGLLVAASVVFSLQAFNAKQAAERERDSLKKENDSLVLNINERVRENQRLNERLNMINESLDKVSREKNDFEQKYLLVARERDELAQKLSRPAAVAMQIQSAPAAIADDIYWAKVLKEKTDLELQIGNIRKDLREIQIKNEELQRDKSALELEVRSQVREKHEANRQMEYNQKLMDTISQELVREKNDKFQIEDGLKSLKNENLTLRRQLSSLNNRKIVLERKLADLQSKSANLEKGFNEMDGLLKDKMVQIDTLKRQIEPSRVSTFRTEKRQESVELPPIIVRPQSAADAEEVIVLPTGKVLAVKRDNNFVIINLGQDAGVTLGNVFGVYRGQEAIADIEVIQTRKSISACDIKKEFSPIKVGDMVR